MLLYTRSWPASASALIPHLPAENWSGNFPAFHARIRLNSDTENKSDVPSSFPFDYSDATHWDVTLVIGGEYANEPSCSADGWKCCVAMRCVRLPRGCVVLFDSHYWLLSSGVFSLQGCCLPHKLCLVRWGSPETHTHVHTFRVFVGCKESRKNKIKNATNLGFSHMSTPL